MEICDICQKNYHLIWKNQKGCTRCSKCLIGGILTYSIPQKFIMIGDYYTSENLENIKKDLYDVMVEMRISSIMSYNENMEKRLIFQHELKV